MRTIGNTPVDGEVRAVASGALANGDTVIVNADGTVSVVALNQVTDSAGTPVSFESAQASYVSATFDSVNNKVVIAYGDEGNNNYGTAVVGTVSGTSISFGTPVVFASATSDYNSATFDATSGKVVIACARGGTNGGAIVGTVSGTSISFGAFAFIGGGTISFHAATFDSAAEKVVIAYRDNGNSNRGTAVVGTVSGTSISYGSPTVFETGSTDLISATFDSNANKVVFSYRDVSNSNYGAAVIGTVSGTSISFGTPVFFESDSITGNTSTTFDSSSNKTVTVYGRDNVGKAVVGTVSGTSISFGTPVVYVSQEQIGTAVTFDPTANKSVISFRLQPDGEGTLVVGTVSGTSISFGSSVEFESGSAYYPSSTFDSNSDRVVIGYTILGGGESNAVVFRNAASIPNLTSENYIGIAKGAAANGTSAVVQTGCSINDAQSGLTAGQDYYVQADGTLGTSPADPSVFAGTAVSATKLIVKG